MDKRTLARRRWLATSTRFRMFSRNRRPGTVLLRLLILDQWYHLHCSDSISWNARECKYERDSSGWSQRHSPAITWYQLFMGLSERGLRKSGRRFVVPEEHRETRVDSTSITNLNCQTGRYNAIAANLLLEPRAARIRRVLAGYSEPYLILENQHFASHSYIVHIGGPSTQPRNFPRFIL